jgi:hypothetical protein
MQDARKQRRAEKDANLKALQCPTCKRWFSTINGRRVHCYRCEEGQGSDQ